MQRLQSKEFQILYKISLDPFGVSDYFYAIAAVLYWMSSVPFAWSNVAAVVLQALQCYGFCFALPVFLPFPLCPCCVESWSALTKVTNAFKLSSLIRHRSILTHSVSIRQGHTPRFRCSGCILRVSAMAECYLISTTHHITSNLMLQLHWCISWC